MVTFRAFKISIYNDDFTENYAFFLSSRFKVEVKLGMSNRLSWVMTPGLPTDPARPRPLAPNVP